MILVTESEFSMGKALTIALTGGGSGGHITPLLAVADEIKRLTPEAKLIYIGQYGDKLGDIPAKDRNIDAIYTVRAGKFRRYHGGGLRQFLDPVTLLKNIRDAVYVLIGIWQSIVLLRKIRPSIIFVKGGFVGVPVGLSAAILGIPFITHDSDSVPGLANRIIAPWARLHAVALPKEIYAYPTLKTVTTGIPLQSKFVTVNEQLKNQYRAKLKLPEGAPVLFIIGGGQGAQRINSAVIQAVPHLLKEFKELRIIHGVGRANEAIMRQTYSNDLSADELNRLHLFGYESDIYLYSGAADLIITRAGATNLAEFAVQGRACIVIPSPYLTSGHQLKNAQYLADNQAAVVLSESDIQADPNRLAKQVSDLLKNLPRRAELATNLARFAKPDATRDLAKLIIDQTANLDK